ncbi:hypothetical protein [Actinomadura xylanilytica]|uniref:hypothetical protein n=1 Tax=Actinomadura xylanilytica TaxID=887459 RepID=UPI00255A7FB5|nr:hypothetical protein [Actinomadura xylanilytica]MDL4774700.1 hypothetical protein [Actinomadura xylanilytica]
MLALCGQQLGKIVQEAIGVFADVEQALATAAAAGLRSADTPCSDREMSGSGDSFPA